MPGNCRPFPAGLDKRTDWLLAGAVLCAGADNATAYTATVQDTPKKLCR